MAKSDIFTNHQHSIISPKRETAHAVHKPKPQRASTFSHNESVPAVRIPAAVQPPISRSSSPIPDTDCMLSLGALRFTVEHFEFKYNDSYQPHAEDPNQLIDCKHFLEVQDSKHRYGTYLLPYHDIWLATASTEPFFKWLDEGAGLFVDASKVSYIDRPHRVSRADLEKTVVEYLNEKESQKYRVKLHNGKLVWLNGNEHNEYRRDVFVDTGFRDEKWIFVIDEHGQFFLNKKRKGSFHHSSFVNGRPVRAAGRVEVRNGDLLQVGPHSGHYKTTYEQLLRAVEQFFGFRRSNVSAKCESTSSDFECS